MKVAAELLISSSLVFMDAEESHKIVDPAGRFSLMLRNNPDAGPFQKRSLRGVMEFEVDSLDEARERALDNFAIVQNALTYTTGAKFRDVTVIKAFDWTPGIADREARYYATSEADPSHPLLDAALISSTERMIALQSGEVSQAVMRWYRLGIRSEMPEEQFSYFWFAIEIVAEELKEAGKVTTKCHVCQTELLCETCGKVPERRRFGSEAITDLIHKIAPANSNKKELSDTLLKIRNTIQHGRRISSIIDSLPCTEDEALNVVAKIAWHSIFMLRKDGADPRPAEDLPLIEIDGIANKRFVMTAHIVTRLMSNDHDNPDINNAPSIELSTVIDGKNYSLDGMLIERDEKP